MNTVTPTLVVCEQSDRWRLAWQTWQSRLVRGESSPAVVRSVRQPDELAAAIERWQPAGVLLEIAVTNQVAVCQAIAQFAKSWPRGLSFVVGSSAARSTESAARWAGAAGCAWSARELPPLVEWFARCCQKLDVPAGSWEESIRASLPWVAETALLPAASPTPDKMR
jgi:hypothetical protein